MSPVPLAGAGPLLSHGPSHDGSTLGDAVEVVLATGPMVLAALAAVVYAAAATAERRRRGWSAGRTVMFVGGCLVLALSLSPPVDGSADASFSGHAAQHLLLAMLTPLGIVLGAPVTLALRTLPLPGARRLGRALRSRPVAVLTRPSVALVLNSGGLLVLYLTPLYALSTRSTAVHMAVHLHMLLAGVLFAWVIAGPDPAPGRATVRVRLVVLGIAIAVHATVSQLLYAGLFVKVDAPASQLQAAGSLMYFGGDIIELMLALALLLTWRTRPRTTHEGPETRRSRGPAVPSGSRWPVRRTSRPSTPSRAAAPAE